MHDKAKKMGGCGCGCGTGAKTTKAKPADTSKMTPGIKKNGECSIKAN